MLPAVAATIADVGIGRLRNVLCNPPLENGPSKEVVIPY
jgi:hypothetical protein